MDARPRPKRQATEMKLSNPLVRGTLLRRYKRFLSDVQLESGEIITAHCANPGAMTGLDGEGLVVWLSKSDNPKRKLAWSWELAELPTGLVGINTAHPNRIIGEALHEGKIAELSQYRSIRPEVKYGEGSRIDFLLTEANQPDCYLEVKNVHLSRTPALAEFPDAATARGAKHLRELTNMVLAGHRAVNLYLVQRMDCTSFTLAKDIDPAYDAAFAAARAAGVEILCYACHITQQEIVISNALPIND